MSEFPETVRLRNTGLHDDLGGGGQTILTSSGRGFQTQTYVLETAVMAKTAELEAERDRLAEQLAEARELLLDVLPQPPQYPDWYKRRDALLKALAGEGAE